MRCMKIIGSHNLSQFGMLLNDDGGFLCFVSYVWYVDLLSFMEGAGRVDGQDVLMV